MVISRIQAEFSGKLTAKSAVYGAISGLAEDSRARNGKIPRKGKLWLSRALSKPKIWVEAICTMYFQSVGPQLY